MRVRTRFNPRPHAGRDFVTDRFGRSDVSFNPRAPCGARPLTLFASVTANEFQSTRPMRGATGESSQKGGAEESFNPRAPCGARLRLRGFSSILVGFQSTRPMRGATSTTLPKSTIRTVSIHAPHAGRDTIANGVHLLMDVSIHAPHAGRDRPVLEFFVILDLVSIHAPHAGRDKARSAACFFGTRFNPRAPCGARPR